MSGGFWSDENRKSSNSGGGNKRSVPWSNVTGEFIEFTEVGGRPAARVTLSSEALGSAYPKGSEAVIYFPKTKSDSMKDRFEFIKAPDQGDPIQVGGTLIFENVKLQDGVLEANYVSTMSASPDPATDIVMTDVIVRASVINERKNAKGEIRRDQTFEIIRPDLAVSVTGDTVYNPYQAIVDQYNEVAASGEAVDPDEVAQWEAAAQAFNDASPEDRAKMVMDLYSAHPDLQPFGDRVHFVIRAVNLGGNPEEAKSYRAFTLYGQSVQGEDGTWGPASAEDLVRNGIVENNTAQNAQERKMIWSAVAGETPPNTMIEIIPIVSAKAGPRLNKMKKLELERANDKVTAWNPEGAKVAAFLRGHVAFRAYKTEEGEPTSYFVRDIKARDVVSYTKKVEGTSDREVVTSYRNAWSPSLAMMPTVNLPEAFQTACDKAARERGQKLDPNFKAENNNNNDHSDPDYDKEAQGPSPR